MSVYPTYKIMSEVRATYIQCCQAWWHSCHPRVSASTGQKGSLKDDMRLFRGAQRVRGAGALFPSLWGRPRTENEPENS